VADVVFFTRISAQSRSAPSLTLGEKQQVKQELFVFCVCPPLPVSRRCNKVPGFVVLARQRRAKANAAVVSGELITTFAPFYSAMVLRAGKRACST